MIFLIIIKNCTINNCLVYLFIILNKYLKELKNIFFHKLLLRNVLLKANVLNVIR